MKNNFNHQEMANARQQVGQNWGKMNPERWRRVRQLPLHNTILDVGCSTGDYVLRLREIGYQAWGTDILREKSWDEHPVWFVQSDALCLPFSDKIVDTVLLFEVLEHLPRPAKYLREFSRVCRHTILLSVPNCTVPADFRQAGFTFHHWVDPTHVNFFTSETLSQLITEAGLKLEKMEIINFVRPEALWLATWGFRGRWVNALSRGLEKIPWRTKYGMTLLATITV
ncbi:MAG: class I SAM-dependent methyltransferase [Chloroflexi bacterium]|nr:class I SAM-dependent methyltransferase [Chloroflexota bacterium]